MLKRTIIFVMACTLSAPLLTSCGDDSSGSKDNGGDKVCPGSCDTGFHCDESTGYVCVADAAPGPENQCPAEGCGEGKHCDEATKTCVADNTPEKQCPADCGEGKHCDEATKECVADSTPDKTCPDSCDEGFHCDESTGFECVEDSKEEQCPAEGCDEGYHCDESTGFECVADGAEKKCPDDGCGAGKRCDESTNFECVVIPEFSCPASCDEGFHCDDTTNSSCVADDDPQKVGCPACADGFKCVMDSTNEDGETVPGTGGKCVQVDDEGNIVKDDDGNDVQGCPVCPADSHCDENFKCANDGYVEPDPNACSGDEKRCDGDVLMVCGEEGVFVEGETCGSEENPNQKCFMNEEGIWGCFDSECTPGETRCSDTVVMICNDSHKLVAGDDCASKEETPICEQGDGHAECIASCTEGESKCLDNKVMVCGADGLFAMSSECDAAKSACIINDNGAPECKDYECSGEVKKCDGDKLLQCDKGWWTEFSDCAASGYVCKTESDTNAICAVKNCEDGQKKCSNDYLMECSGGEFSKVAESCQNSGKKCVEENGSSFCKEIKVAQQGNDTDGDTIIDALECHPEDTELGFTEPNEACVDSDKDGKKDYEDTDSDNDTIPDKIEANNDGGKYEPEDADYDGLPNYIDTDSDDNGILDKVEVGSDPNKPLDTDGDTVPDYLDYDNDGDGFSDVDEIKGLITNNKHETDGHFSGACGGNNALGTAAKPVDCDGDGKADYMDTDSDNDGLSDKDEGMLRLASNGFLARYNSDTDGDSISDKIEGLTDDSDGDGIPNFLEVDSDNDGLSDKDEYALESQEPCKSAGIKPRLSADADGDTFKDAAEYAVAQETQKSGYTGTKYTPAQMICNKAIGVKTVYNFYFELPDNKTDNDVLLFTPKVSKLDVVFNVDTTGSMGGTISSVKTNVSSIITNVRNMVSDSGFALVNFDDYPDVSSHDGSSSWSTAGSSSAGDLPFRLLGAVSTNASTVEGYTKNSLFTTRSGWDGAESGTCSLYRIVTGEKMEWYSNSTYKSIDAASNGSGTWGGVGFRKDTLPVVVHVSDIYSHEAANSTYLNRTNLQFSYKECTSSDKSKCVISPRYTDHLVPKLKSTGTRVISLNVGSGDNLGQMTTWSRESNAIVPACAFKTASNTWNCNGNTNANMCCLGSAKAAQTVEGKANQCILVYSGSQSSVSTYIAQGVDALVKYGTYSVKTKLRGNAIGNGKNTTCFIDKIEAKAYIAPPAEPEKSCNPTATPAKLGESYNSGFTNFATGTSNVNKQGAQLTFTVYAKNDGCYKQDKQTHVFEAYIDVYDPTTNLLFDTQKVSIIVPALIDSNIGESGD